MTENKKVGIFLGDLSLNKSFTNKIYSYCAKKSLQVEFEYIDLPWEKRFAISQLEVDIVNKKINLLIVNKNFDLSKNIREISRIFYLLYKNNIDFISLADNLNTIEQGKEIFTLFITFVAANQTSYSSHGKLIQQGIRNAKLRGKKLGRPPVVKAKIMQAKKMREQGSTYREIGKILKINETTIRKRLNKFKYD